MVILITAGRNIRDGRPIEAVLRHYAEKYGAANIVLRHGAARGGDSYANFYARRLRYASIEAFPIEDEDWNRLGLAAGNIRNEEMLDTEEIPSLVIAFPDNASRGTYNCVDQALKRNIPTIMYPYYLSSDNPKRIKYHFIIQEIYE